MKAIWKFPALVRGTPQNSREERLCLVAGKGEFEISELDLADMPLVMTAELHHKGDTQEYRLYDGQLYELIDRDWDHFEVELDCADTMAHGFSYVYKDIAEEILDIMKSGTENAWPKNAHLHRDTGARDLDKSGVKLTAEGENDLRFWEERFRHGMTRFAIAGGKPWRKIAEPIWSVSMNDNQVILDDASCFTAKRDDLGKTHYATNRRGANYRMFSVADVASVEEIMAALAATHGREGERMDKVEIIMPDAFHLDVDRLEMDRIARIAVTHVGNAMSTVKPGGGATFLEVAPSSVTASWMALRDFVSSYDPLESVPEELEDVFGRFVEQAGLMNAMYGEAFLPAPVREAITYAFRRWDNRQISISPAASMPMGM